MSYSFMKNIFVPIKAQWHFVLKIVLAYCEEKTVLVTTKIIYLKTERSKQSWSKKYFLIMKWCEKKLKCVKKRKIKKIMSFMLKQHHDKIRVKYVLPVFFYWLIVHFDHFIFALWPDTSIDWEIFKMEKYGIIYGHIGNKGLIL